MADRQAQIRGLIVKEAERRPSTIEWIPDPSQWHPKGKPRGDQLALALGVSPTMIARVLNGNPSKGKDVKKPRSAEYSPSPELLEGIRSWLNLVTISDVWAAIEQAEPVPPFKKTRSENSGPKPKGPDSSPTSDSEPNQIH